MVEILLRVAIPAGVVLADLANWPPPFPGPEKEADGPGTQPVAILRHAQDYTQIKWVVETARAAGFRYIELPFNHPPNPDFLRRLTLDFQAEAQRGELRLGAGTVLGSERAKRALDIPGCRYIISPVFEPAVHGLCQAAGVDYIPGVYTPTEIWNAFQAGCPVVKLFPASAFQGKSGPGLVDFIKALREPINHPDLRLLVSGGVNKDNIAAYAAAGARYVAVGASLFDPELIKAGRREELAQRCESFMAALRAANAGRLGPPKPS